MKEYTDIKLKKMEKELEKSYKFLKQCEHMLNKNIIGLGDFLICEMSYKIRLEEIKPLRLKVEREQKLKDILE